MSDRFLFLYSFSVYMIAFNCIHNLYVKDGPMKLHEAKPRCLKALTLNNFLSELITYLWFITELSLQTQNIWTWTLCYFKGIWLVCIMCAQYSCDLPVGIKGICCCSGACYCCKLFSQALKLKCKITSFYDAFFWVCLLYFVLRNRTY